MKLLIDKKRLMINYIKKCDSDIIISTRDIHNKWLGKYGNNKALKIGWEHNHHHGNFKYAKKIVDSVKDLDYLVLVSDALKEYYKQELKSSKCKCIYIPNSLDEIPSTKSTLNQKRIISVGRLAKEKGYSDLINVFASVHKKHPDWTLDIVGDGVLYESLSNEIKQLKLDKYITLHGFQRKDYINKLLKKSSIYVMTSHTESFGLSLVEAMSFGIPCVAFDSAEGANEIISNNKDGYLIPNRDKELMTDKINELIEDKKLRDKIGKNASKKSLLYDKKAVKKKWINILK
jgi:N-acetylglucosaminyldiphosphoundecaprenol N-acetyl-beta-D-mannosaminyltransferase